MESISEFLHMGGYALYVWTSYAIALVVLVVNVIQPLLCQRRMKRALARKSRLARRHA